MKVSSNLDFLRAVAVLLVLAQHLMSRFFGHSPPIGGFGVLIFFVHTSLVLMHSMERSHLRGRALFLNFYSRRFFRVYPLSILAVLVAVALHLDSGINGVPGLSHVSSISTGRIVSNLLLMQNVIKPGSIVNVLWSLPFEVQMYFFLPFLFLWAVRRATVRTVLALWLLAVIAAVARDYSVLHSQVGSLAWRLSLLHFVPNFLPGILAFVIPVRPILPSRLWPPAVFAITAIFLLLPTSGMGWVLCLLLGFAIPIFGEIQSPWLRELSHRIATYSYGIYLSHQFCIWLVGEPMSASPLLLRIAVLVVTLVTIPILLYHSIEKPFIDLGFRVAQAAASKNKKTTLATTEV